MIKKYSLLLIAFLSLFLSCSNTKSTKSNETVLTPAALQFYGRYRIKDNKDVELISSAVHFGFSFEGKECEVYASLLNEAGHNYLQYELDGVYKKRIRVEGNNSRQITITAPTSGKHTVWIYKATEAHTGPIMVQKIVGENIKPLQKPSQPFIEFIGNSITCGAAADPSEVPCNTGEYHDQHNAYLAYGPRVARALSAEFMLSSVSGIGIYRNWNSNGPTMPQVYEKTDFQDGGKDLWDFDRFNPKVVSIALGTNDFSEGDGKNFRAPFDSALFVNNYIKFVQLVRSKYPKAKIALLSSPMVNGSRRVLLQNCLTAVKIGVDGLFPTQKPMALFFFKPMQARGCGGHPSVEDHAYLAEELTPFFKQLLNE